MPNLPIEDYECMLCDTPEDPEALAHNCFLIDIRGGRSYRCYNTCNRCASRLRQISPKWYHIFTDKEIASIAEGGE